MCEGRERRTKRLEGTYVGGLDRHTLLHSEDGQAHKHGDRKTIDRQTDMQTDRQAGRHADSQTMDK